MAMTRWILALGVVVAAAAADAAPQQLLYFVAREQLRRVDIDTIVHPPILEDTLIGSTGDDEHAVPGPAGGGNVNGTLCVLPGGRMVMGEDAGQTAVPAGWAVYEPDGKMVGKLVTTAFDFPEPAGCAVDSQGRLFTVEVGQESFGGANGQLILWFPPFDRYPGTTPYPNASYSTNYCKLAIDIGTATNVAFDDQGRILVTSPQSGNVYRYTGPLPTAPDALGGCGRIDATGASLVDAGRLSRDVFIHSPKVGTPSGIARSPNGGWYLGDVLFGRIAEFDANGVFLRYVMNSGTVTSLPTLYGNPQSIAIDAQGTVYYADLALEGTIFTPETGANGKVWRVAFDTNGEPLPPEIVVSNLGFPDGVAVLPGNLEPTEWRTLGGSVARTYFNPTEETITKDNVAQLVKRWEFPTTAIVTDSPSVARCSCRGKAASRWSSSRTGTASSLRCGSRTARGSGTYRATRSRAPTILARAQRTSRTWTAPTSCSRVGETLYALDAATGEEIWHFTAGTGCRRAGRPARTLRLRRRAKRDRDVADRRTARCLRHGRERPRARQGRLLRRRRATDGRMRWFFDLESAVTCGPIRPTRSALRRLPQRRELGLPADFLATRAGCGVDRTPTGCGNVWSSPAVDFARGRLFRVEQLRH